MVTLTSCFYPCNECKSEKLKSDNLISQIFSKYLKTRNGWCDWSETGPSESGLNCRRRLNVQYGGSTWKWNCFILKSNMSFFSRSRKAKSSPSHNKKSQGPRDVSQETSVGSFDFAWCKLWIYFCVRCCKMLSNAFYREVFFINVVSLIKVFWSP